PSRWEARGAPRRVSPETEERPLLGAPALHELFEFRHHRRREVLEVLFLALPNRLELRLVLVPDVELVERVVGEARRAVARVLDPEVDDPDEVVLLVDLDRPCLAEETAVRLQLDDPRVVRRELEPLFFFDQEADLVLLTARTGDRLDTRVVLPGRIVDDERPGELDRRIDEQFALEDDVHRTDLGAGGLGAQVDAPTVWPSRLPTQSRYRLANSSGSSQYGKCPLLSKTSTRTLGLPSKSSGAGGTWKSYLPKATKAGTGVSRIACAMSNPAQPSPVWPRVAGLSSDASHQCVIVVLGSYHRRGPSRSNHRTIA